MSDIESDQIPQHDPPRDAELVQPEVDERRDSLVVEGDDPEHVLPPTELDLYTPEPGRRAGDRRPFAAMWVALLIFLGLIAWAVYLAVT